MVSSAEFEAFIREQFNDKLEEAVEALQNPAGVAKKLAQKKMMKAG